MIWRAAFQVISACAWTLAVIAVVRPMRLGRKWTVILSAALALAFGKFAFFALAGGHSFNPNLPQLVIRTCCVLYGTAMFLTALSFLALLSDGVMGLLGHPVKTVTVRFRTAAFVVCAASLAAWGMYEGVRLPSVSRLEIEYDALPAAFDGYRVVHMSDLHCSTAARRSRFEKIVKLVNDIDADLVAITGDFVDGLVPDRRDDLAPIAGLRARDGVLACTGNHEAYWDWESWRDALLGFGLVFPEITGPVVIRRGEDAIAVGGMVDPALSGKIPVEFLCDAADCFEGSPANAFRILLCHRPSTDMIASASEKANLRLELSGHTHGGGMPILSSLVSLTNEGHVRGLYEFAPGRYLHVSPGSGQWAGFPMRFFNPCEITEIVLKKAKGRLKN